VARVGEVLHAVARHGDIDELLCRGDLQALLSPGDGADRPTVTKLLDALGPALRALDDEQARLVLLLDYLQVNARHRAAARAVPLAPWDAPRVRPTQHHPDPNDVNAGTYAVWIDATLADVAEHFAARGAYPTDSRRSATNLALARLLRAAVLSSRRGDLEALDEMAEPARLYLQKSKSQGDVAIPVPAGPARPTERATQRLYGDPLGSIVVVPGGDIVAPGRQEPAVLLRDALASVLSPDTSPARSDEQIVNAAWSYFVTPLFQPITCDLPPIPIEPSEDMAKKLAAAVHQARLAAKGSNDDPEDTAERVLRALLRALGYPANKTRSLLDPLRKKAPAET